MTTDPRVETDGSSPQDAPWQILIVSDSVVEQKLLSGLFGRYQHRPFVAYGGRDALLKWSETEFDAVVLDPLLAEMHGADLVREIRQRESGKPPIPIIVLSEDPNERERCCQAGANACLGRPLKFDEFQECVRVARHSAVHREETTNVIPVDWKVALDAVGGRRELLAELISLFETEYPTTLATISLAIERGDAKSLQVSAHQLKGCLRYFGRSVAGDLAAELENLGRAGSVAGANGKLEPLATAIQRLLPLLRQGPG